MPGRIFLCGWLLLCVAVTKESAAQNRPTKKQIEVTVSRGAQFLKTGQRPDGSWSYAGHNVGITALASLALQESGLPPTDARLMKAHDYIITNAAELVQTYNISMVLLFLDRYGSDGDAKLMLSLGQRLVAGQLDSGGWTYTCTDYAHGTSSQQRDSNSPLAQRMPRTSRGQVNVKEDIADNSNTQFAVLGLWAARNAGLDVRDAMKRVDQRFRSTQARNGQWNYRPGVNLTSDSMSCAGLISLVLAKGHRTIEDHKVANGDSATSADVLEMPSDDVIDRALARVDRIRMSSKSSLHLIWCLGRVAVALGLTEIGKLPWYERGAKILIRTQNRDGSWRNRTPVPPSSKTADTAFAILFLCRSNLTRDVPHLVTNGS